MSIVCFVKGKKTDAIATNAKVRVRKGSKSSAGASGWRRKVTGHWEEGTQLELKHWEEGTQLELKLDQPVNEHHHRRHAWLAEWVMSNVATISQTST